MPWGRIKNKLAVNLPNLIGPMVVSMNRLV